MCVQGIMALRDISKPCAFSAFDIWYDLESLSTGLFKNIQPDLHFANILQMELSQSPWRKNLFA